MIVAAGLGTDFAEAAGVAGRAEVAHVRDADELRILLQSPRDWHAILLGPAVERPLDVARAIRGMLPDVLVAVLAEPSEAARLQHDLLLAPIRGEPVRCVPLDAHAPRVVEQHLRHALLRRRYTQTVRHANRAIETGTATAAKRLPPAMEQLLEATPLPMLVVEHDGRLLHRNRAARDLQPARAVTLGDALTGMDVAALAQLLGARAARRTAWRGRWYDLLASPLLVPPALDATLVILDDVTELVLSEEARRKESELHATLLAVQSDMGVGMFVLAEERIAYANAGLARMLGRTEAELVGSRGLDHLAPDERERVLDIHRRRRRGEPAPEVYETRFLDASGRTFPVELSARSLQDARSTLILARDITRRQEMQAEVEQARAGLAQMDKLATVGSLVGGLAHEIRTPLAAIMNEANLIERQVSRALAAADPKAELADISERVAALNASIERIRRLMGDMRTFMRGEVPRKALLLLDDCVSDAVRFFAATQQGNVRVETRLASQQRIEADGAQLQQIVINLLQNAAEASPSGGVVTVETRDEPGAVVLAVVDRGTGIAPELKARMFEAFVTTKPRGSGLGLTIVRRLAEVHAASIQVDSARGAGTRFELRFRAR